MAMLMRSIRVFGLPMRSISTLQESIIPAATQQMRTKHKVPQKRASKLLSELKQEEFEKLKAGRKFPEILPGDSVLIEKLPYVTATTPEIVKGLVIAKTNRASDTAITLLNVEHGTPIQRRLVLYSPLIKDIKVLQRAFIHKGKKRVRRSKLYYLWNRHPDCYTVK